MPAAPKRRGPVDQLLADVIAAGGELQVEDAGYGRLENLVSSAIRFNKVPAGKLLTVGRGSSWSERLVRVTDLPEWIDPELDSGAVIVKERLGRPHPAVVSLRDDRNQLSMNKQVRGRALRILDALATAATARGFTVAIPPEEGQHRRRVGVLQFGRLGHDITVDIVEQNDRAPHEPTAKELRDHERYSWNKIPSHDQIPSGRLEIQILTGTRYGWSSIADIKSKQLEDRLSTVIRELEIRIVLHEQQRQELERAEAERKRQWEAAHEQAKIAAREQHRAQILDLQVKAWRDSQDLGVYVAAMADHIQNLSGPERDEAREWLAWADERRQRLDPLRNPLKMPQDPEFTHKLLAPHMRGYSPYGHWN